MNARFAPMVTPPRLWTRRATICCLLLVVGCTFGGPLFAEQEPVQEAAGNIRGTVKDPSGAVISGAVVTLQAAGSTGQERTTVTDEAGEFHFSPAPKATYKLTITAGGFEPWTAENLAPTADENPSPISVTLRVAATSTQLNVSLPPHELAAEQIKTEEKQRLLGVFPNFLVTYEPNAAPLTAKQKLQIGGKMFFDPVPILFSAFGAGVQQAHNRFPEYGQGAEGFAKRFGANYGDRVDSILIGRIVTQSVLHQDPRYFYKSTGGFGSRALYAIGTAFVAKGDNGHWQPPYADVLGGMGAYEISSLYRPGTSRPVLRLEHTILLGFAGRVTRNLMQQFVEDKLTTHVPKKIASRSHPVLQSGTSVTLISVEDLSAKTAANSGPIGFTLASDLQVGGTVVAKAGASASGQVNFKGLNIDLERVHMTVGKVDIPLRSTQVRGVGSMEYHQLENSGRIVIVLYVDKDVTLSR